MGREEERLRRESWFRLRNIERTGEGQKSSGDSEEPTSGLGHAVESSHRAQNPPSRGTRLWRKSKPFFHTWMEREVDGFLDKRKTPLKTQRSALDNETLHGFSSVVLGCVLFYRQWKRHSKEKKRRKETLWRKNVFRGKKQMCSCAEEARKTSEAKVPAFGMCCPQGKEP